MHPLIVPAQAVCIRPHIINIIRDLCGRYVFYLDVGGSTYEVLGFGTAPDILIVFGAPAPTGDGNRAIEILADDFENGQQFRIYGIESAATPASELTPGEVGA